MSARKKYRYDSAIFLGRFQPMHKGHNSVLNKMLHDCKTIKIVVGSSQYKRINKNPLSTKERKNMILKVVQKLDKKIQKRISIFALKDTNDNHTWIKSLKKRFSANAIYTSNPLVQVLSVNINVRSKAPIDIINIKNVVPTQFQKISATKVRTLISKNNKNWEKLVPKEVSKFLKENKLIEVIKESEIKK